MGKQVIPPAFSPSKRSFLNRLQSQLPNSWLSALATSFLFLIVVLVAIFFSQKNNLYSFLHQTNPPLKKTQSISHNSFKKEIIGFLPSWMVAKKIKVDTKNLSQIIYFGLAVNSDGSLVKFDEKGAAVAEWTYFNSPEFSDLQKEASKSGTKVLLSIKNFDNKNIDNLVSNPNSTNRFITQLNELIKTYKLDGINIDFEYLTDSNYPTFKYFNKFFTTLKNSLKKDNSNLIISADISGNAVLSDKAYDMVKIGDVIDQIILMAYDYKTANSTISGPIAPLYSSQGEDSVDKSVNSLIGRVPLEKVVLGIPFYGYEWQTTSYSYKASTIENTGALATIDRTSKLLGNRDDLKLYFDDKTASPWLSYTQSGAIKQIYYEDEKSIAKKLEYVNQKNLAGVAIWALGYEGSSDKLWQAISKQVK
ncbi:glycoside hydrolase family 18 protein [Candidatus Daviesbacteria bacterium]|nr:glycoside hydrolase family 18 protein [Candidatus Daviesbacteria bacterium]